MGVEYSDDCMYVKHIWVYVFTLRDCTIQQAPYGSGIFSSVLPCTNGVRQLYAMNSFLTMYVSGTSILNIHLILQGSHFGLESQLQNVNICALL